MAHVVTEALPGTHESPERGSEDAAYLHKWIPIRLLEVELDAGDRDIFPEFTYCQGSEIRGHLLMKTFQLFHCRGVEVALEGIATVNYKSGNIVVNNTTNLLPFEWTKVSLFIPVPRQNVVSSIPGVYTYSPLPVANYRIPFCIPIPKNFPFAGTFKGDFGKIEYRVSGLVHAVYGNPCREVHAHKSVQIKSYLSLKSLPDSLLRPRVFKYCEDNSFFFKSPCFKYSFSLDQSGFIAGDSIHFILRLDNPKKKTIQKITASLKKRVEFAGEASVKSKLYILDVSENPNFDSSDQSCEWEDSLKVPQDAHPTTKRIIIRHQYFIQVEVRTADEQHSVLTKNIPIVVGTVRYGEYDVEDNWSLCRTASLVSIDSFAESESGFLPAYSTLSSQRSSLQTLPPLYETNDKIRKFVP